MKKKRINYSKRNSLNYLILDTETTIKNKGHPFTPDNKLCYVGVKDSEGNYYDFDVEYSGNPYGDNIRQLSSLISRVQLLVGFNLKFDLHWLRRYDVFAGIDIPAVYDCQLAEFILGNQEEPFPSLNKSCDRYGLGTKLDVVANEYWANGIDTPLVPQDTLRTYLQQDVDLTERLFLVQRELFKQDLPKRRMFWLQCQDLLILEEMEWNGMKFDFETTKELSAKAELQIQEIDAKLRELVPIADFNFGSSDQLSALLYGGSVWYPYRETYTRTLKDGRTSVKERWAKKETVFERMVKPLPGTEGEASAGISEQDLERTNEDRAIKGQLPIQRIYSVGEPVLKQLRTRGKAKRIIELILQRAELEKLNGTYYKGLLEKQGTYQWTDCLIHGEFNQVVAITGRLSSSKPNLQNPHKKVKELFVSRYDN